DDSYTFEIGKGSIVHAGHDVTVVATGMMLTRAIEAAKRLAEEGVSVRVIDMPTIKPIDEEILLEAATETKGIVTAEEHSIFGGLGSIVGAYLAEHHPTRVVKVGLQDTFGESGDPLELMDKYHLNSAAIIDAVKKIIE
ncbi:MAG: transketolase C-terminal domain-containing protein, partial [Bacilli bacterium]